MKRGPSKAGGVEPDTNFGQKKKKKDPTEVQIDEQSPKSRV